MKNKIDIQNYEAFLLDYMEGNLSSEETVALQLFAAQHPHLEIDLNDLELVGLATVKIMFLVFICFNFFSFVRLFVIRRTHYSKSYSKILFGIIFMIFYFKIAHC